MQVKRRGTPIPLQKLLQGVQLSSGPHAAGLPETTVLLGLLQGDRDAIATFVDLVSTVDILNAAHDAVYAGELYAQ